MRGYTRWGTVFAWEPAEVSPAATEIDLPMHRWVANLLATPRMSDSEEYA